MNDTMTDIFNSSQNNVNNVEPILTIDQMINTNNNVEPASKTNAQVVNQTKQKKKIDKVLMIQIFLLVLWIVLTTIIYFFGYDFFEPFIKV